MNIRRNQTQEERQRHRKEKIELLRNTAFQSLYDRKNIVIEELKEDYEKIRMQVFFSLPPFRNINDIINIDFSNIDLYEDNSDLNKLIEKIFNNINIYKTLENKINNELANNDINVIKLSISNMIKNFIIHKVDNNFSRIKEIKGVIKKRKEILSYIQKKFTINTRVVPKTLNFVLIGSLLTLLKNPIINYNNKTIYLDDINEENFYKFIEFIFTINVEPVLYFKLYNAMNPLMRKINVENFFDERKDEYIKNYLTHIKEYCKIMNQVYDNINFYKKNNCFNDEYVIKFKENFEDFINNNITYFFRFENAYTTFMTLKNDLDIYLLFDQLNNIYILYENYLKNLYKRIIEIVRMCTDEIMDNYVINPINTVFHNNALIDEEYRNYLDNDNDNNLIIIKQLDEELENIITQINQPEDFMKTTNIIDHQFRYFLRFKIFILSIFFRLIPLKNQKILNDRNINWGELLIHDYGYCISLNFNSNTTIGNIYFNENNENIYYLYELVNKEEYIKNILYNIDNICYLLKIDKKNIILKFLMRYLMVDNNHLINGIPQEKIEIVGKYFNYISLIYGLSINKIRTDEAKWDDTWDYSYDNDRFFPNLIDIHCIEIYNTTNNILKIKDDQILRANPLLNIIKRLDGLFFDRYIDERYCFLEKYLEEFQIYTIHNIKNEINCFLNCLIQSNLVDKKIINEISYKIIDQNVSFKTIEDICKLYNLSIKIRYEGKTKKFYYNKENIIIKLYLYRGDFFHHYMLNKKTNITKYFIDNIDEIMKLDKPLDFKIRINRKEGKYYKTKKDTGLRINKLIPLLIEKDILIKLTAKDLIGKLNIYNKHFELDIPLNIISQTKLIEQKEKSQSLIEEYIFFADTECFTQGENHKAYCICFIEKNWTTPKCYYGENCLKSFLNFMSNLDKKVIIYFHNLGYDFRMFNDFQINKTIEKNNKIYAAEILWLNKYKKLKIIKFKDSLCMINTSISNFHSWFKLEGEYEKEIFPYNYYTLDTYETGIIENCWIKEKPIWNEEKINQFKNNLNKLKLIEEDNIHFNSRDYCIYYCKRDVIILKEGWLKFRKMFLDTIGMDIHKSLTISSLAYKYIKQESLINENIYEYSVLLRDWIRQSVIGGRCMTRNNDSYLINEEIYDYDACSLYPSAMKRLFLPTGIPYNLTGELLNYENLKNLTMNEDQIIADENKYISCYVVEIDIFKIGKERHFPLITLKDEKGSNLNVNKLGKMFVTNITLEDLIKFQNIKFNIIKGLYWVGNKSTKLSETIQYLYDFRLKLKQEKNPAQICIKELMNSSYGKTIQKPVLTEIIYKHSKEEFLKYIMINALHIENSYEINDKCFKIVKKITEDNFYTPTLIGSLILSMSKRIMNEVICLGEDLNCKIYYQDTDSIHINKNDLLILETEYEKIYNRKLRGTKMGQFHPDFEEITPGKMPYAIKSIFISKKVYIDKLIDETGKIAYHYRMKGIPPVCIEEKAKQLFGNLNGEELIKLYEKRFYGEKIKFSLSDFKPCFKMSKDFHVMNIENFERII